MKLLIPEFGDIEIIHLVFDYNGTIAIDGILLPSVAEKFKLLSKIYHIHVITADTFGKAAENLNGLGCSLVILKTENQTAEKKEYIQNLGEKNVAAFGNGRNDRLMLDAAKLGIAVLQNEGCATETLLKSDIVVKNIDDALEFFVNNLRLKATLRG